MVYGIGGAQGGSVTVQWLESDGKTRALIPKPGDYGRPNLSPDGRRLAIEVREGSSQDVWVYDWGRDTMTRMTFDGKANTPVGCGNRVMTSGPFPWRMTARGCGTVKYIFADFNSRVQAGQVLAQLGPEIYEAQVTQARGNQLAGVVAGWLAPAPVVLPGHGSSAQPRGARPCASSDPPPRGPRPQAVGWSLRPGSVATNSVGRVRTGEMKARAPERMALTTEFSSSYIDRMSTLQSE